MPIVDYETRISGRYDCPTPQSASPANKGQHALPAVWDMRRPHCVLDVILGTRGVASERTDWCWYNGHTPDSPVMLGAEQAAIYARGASATSCWGAKRLMAMGAALAVGASLGAMAVSCVLGVISGVHWLNASWLVAVSARDWMVGALSWGAVGALMGAFCDWKDWSVAHARFAALHQMALAAGRLRSGLARPGDEEATDRMVRDHLAGGDWALQQAALELEALREAGAATQPKQAKGSAA